MKWDIVPLAQCPSQAEVSSACRKAAAVLSLDCADCEGKLASWRVIAKLVLRVQPDIMARIRAQYLEPLIWASGRYGAVHIRRTDKTAPGWQHEADAIGECKYAERLAELGGYAEGLPVFVATDDLGVVGAFAGCGVVRRLGWEVHHFEADPGRGTSRAVVYRLIAELTLLAEAEWAVVTFSSNMGRLVQLMRERPEASLASLDDCPGCYWQWHEG